MDKPIYTFEDLVKNPGMDLINFEYLLTHPDVKIEVWHRYCYDSLFREIIGRKMLIDSVFKTRFFETFKGYFTEEDNLKR